MNVNTTSTGTGNKRNRSAAVIFGPPGLFLGLTLAALAAGIWIVRSTAASAVPRPAPAATSSTR